MSSLSSGGQNSMDEQAQSSTDVPHETGSEEQAASQPSGKKLLGCVPDLPPWVLIALMILALLITGVVIRQIAGPLSDLVFGNDTDVPIPDGATLISEDDSAGSASRTMRYSTDQDACQVYRFYLSHDGVECTPTPNACTPEGTINLNENTSSFRTVGSCRKTESNTIGGYSWEVIISGGYQQGPATQFFISVFE